MSLTNVWVQTMSDGLVRADQVTGVDAHQTPALTGKPARWLLDVVLSTPTGGGTRGDWAVSQLHRTLIQTSQNPGDAPVVLARLLAQLDVINAAGIIVTIRGGGGAVPTSGSEAGQGSAPGEVAAGSSEMRFRFTPFALPPPGHHTGAEYL